MLGKFFDRRRRKYSWLPRWVAIKSEKDAHPHVPEEHAEWFDAMNTGTTELEILNWLHATILALKPHSILETGAADGLGTIALATACKYNGFGLVHSVELEAERCKKLQERLDGAGLGEFARVHQGDSRDFLRTTNLKFDMGFYDSMCELRADEFEICLNRGIIRQIAVFHDTSPRRCETLKGWPSDEEHLEYIQRLSALGKDPRTSGSFESPLSRGLVAIFIKPVGNGP